MNRGAKYGFEGTVKPFWPSWCTPFWVLWFQIGVLGSSGLLSHFAWRHYCIEAALKITTSDSCCWVHSFLRCIRRIAHPIKGPLCGRIASSFPALDELIGGVGRWVMDGLLEQCSGDERVGKEEDKVVKWIWYGYVGYLEPSWITVMRMLTPSLKTRTFIKMSRKHDLYGKMAVPPDLAYHPCIQLVKAFQPPKMRQEM